MGQILKMDQRSKAMRSRRCPDTLPRERSSVTTLVGDHFFSAIAYGGCTVAAIATGADALYERGDSFVSAITKLLTRMGLRQSCYVAAKSRFLAKRI